MPNLADLALLEKPTQFSTRSKSYAEDEIAWVVGQFDVQGWVEVAPFAGRGNINIHTYEVRIGEREYLLQKVNSDVFTFPERVMDSMLAVLDAQRRALADGYPAPIWEPITLVPTRRGDPYLDVPDAEGRNVWRLMHRIGDCSGYKSLGEVGSRANQLRLAEEVGRGLAVYGDLTASINPDRIEGSLPGYRDTALYFRQFHSVLRGTTDKGLVDFPTRPDVRSATENLFTLAHSPSEFEARATDPEVASMIKLALDHQGLAMELWDALDRGVIRRTLIHGDTKIENFLFCPRTGEAKSLVDLDTIMPFTWLADWGDMVRSMANVAGEVERDLSKITVDVEVVRAVARGFLSAATEVTPAETAMMARAVQIISLELGVRFLTDYLRGDNYFQLGPGDPTDLNKVRARVQLTLFQRLLELGDELLG